MQPRYWSKIASFSNFALLFYTLVMWVTMLEIIMMVGLRKKKNNYLLSNGKEV